MTGAPPRWEFDFAPDDHGAVSVERDQVTWAGWRDGPPPEAGNYSQSVADFLARGPACPWPLPAEVVAAVRAYCESGAWREVVCDEYAGVSVEQQRREDDPAWLRVVTYVAVPGAALVEREGDHADEEVARVIADGWVKVDERVIAGSLRSVTFRRRWRPPPV